MANIRIAVATRNPMMQALLDRLNLGAGPATIKIYSGTQPANADTALSGNTLLATLTFSDPASPAPAAGVLTFSTITEDASADAAATATFARIQDSDGNVVFDGDVGTSGALITLNRTDFAVGGPVRITSFTLTLPATMTF
jgi:hypothetical protein